MNNQSVGRIVELSKRDPLPVCARCIVLEKAINEYLRDYTARSISQEASALKKLREVVGGLQ